MPQQLAGEALWFKDAIIYELHVRAFFDSNNDGMGDFSGLTQKLDYLQDLGVTALWVLPFNPSPWRDDGYDVADYTGVHSAYGTLADFQSFLAEAHKRGLKVITEIVINHTSDQHPWFQRARRSPPGSEWRDFYVWSDTPEKYRDARIIFKDYEPSNWTWDPVAKAYYWHRFFSHQPDLNFDNPQVQRAVLDVVDFWFDMGVDAFRLDAIPYLYEREDTNCENLPETHEFLKQIRRHVDAKYPNRMLLAEANQWPEDAIAYFGNGDECHMAFHFPVMPRLFMANRMEDRYPIIEILEQTPPIPESCQWAMFLRNHDELTLEMVTDEERDYMYRSYATDRQMRLNLGIRRRLAPLLGNDRRKIELMNALLFSLPGTPVIYYGDEIGMGDNIYLGDRNGVRTPMQWSSDRNAGFSRASSQKLYLPITFDPEYHYEAVNVAAQQNNPNSLLWWMKRLIEHRKDHKAFGRGSLEFLRPSNRKILAFVRKYNDEAILVVVNLSRHPQHAQLDLAAYNGCVPVELFGRTDFPAIADHPYSVTLAGYSFYWFALESRAPAQESITTVRDFSAVPQVMVRSWADLRQPSTVAGILRFLPRFIETRRWYQGKGRRIRNTAVQDIVQVTDNTYVIISRLDYTDGDPAFYLLPLGVGRGEEGMRYVREHPDTAFIRIHAADSNEDGVLYGGLWNPEFGRALLEAIASNRTIAGTNGQLLARHTRWFEDRGGADLRSVEVRPSRAEQSNSSILFDQQFILKIFRKVEPGINPEAEVGAFLLDRGFHNAPGPLGVLEYRAGSDDPMMAAILQKYVANQGDAWKYTLDHLQRYYEHALARNDWARLVGNVRGDFVDLAHTPRPLEVHELLETYEESARLLGRRTAEMHLALADFDAGPDFRPEPFSDDYRQGLYYGMLATLNRTLDTIRQRAPGFPSDAAQLVGRVLGCADELRRRLRRLRETRINAVRIRNHGAFHLAQVLYTGKDFYFIDFEGDPGRPISERRLKRSSMRDVAGMLRSLEYAAYTAIYGRVGTSSPRPDLRPLLDTAAVFWSKWAGAAYLESYLNTAGNAAFLPPHAEQLRVLLDAYLIDRALYEIAYEMENRPDALAIPLHGIVNLCSQ